MKKVPAIIVASLSEEISAAREIRKQVFVDEQEIPAHLDDDGLDEHAFHVLCRLEQEFVATGRLIVHSPSVGVLARIAVLPNYRGQGLGRLIVEKLEAIAVIQGLKELRLHPHRHLEAFYSDLGYERVSGTSAVGGHELITMHKNIGRGL